MGNLHVNFTIVVHSPTKIIFPYFTPFLNSHIYAFAILREIATILLIKVIH